MKTKHLTVMFTDISNFTQRSSRQTREQLSALLELHDHLIRPIFTRFQGEIIKTIGDAFLVTFESPTDAVLCGIQIQEALKKHNDQAEDGSMMEVKIAINSGEVTLKNGDIFGEAVNIASRIEGISKSNEIYFTEAVYLSMNKSEIPSAEVGYRHLKGIPHEIKVYKVLKDPAEKSAPKKVKKMTPVYASSAATPKKNWFKIGGIVGGIVLGVLLVGALFSNMNSEDDPDDSDHKEVVELYENEYTIEEFESELEDILEKNEVDHAEEVAAKMREESLDEYPAATLILLSDVFEMANEPDLVRDALDAATEDEDSYEVWDAVLSKTFPFLVAPVQSEAAAEIRGRVLYALEQSHIAEEVVRDLAPDLLRSKNQNERQNMFLILLESDMGAEEIIREFVIEELESGNVRNRKKILSSLLELAGDQREDVLWEIESEVCANEDRKVLCELIQARLEEFE